jgi:hypothetical protein
MQYPGIERIIREAILDGSMSFRTAVTVAAQRVVKAIIPEGCPYTTSLFSPDFLRTRAASLSSSDQRPTTGIPGGIDWDYERSRCAVEQPPEQEKPVESRAHCPITVAGEVCESCGLPGKRKPLNGKKLGRRAGDQ